MKIEEIKLFFTELKPSEQKRLLSDLETIQASSEYNLGEIRTFLLQNKQVGCPHCGHMKYVKNGKSNDIQRYRCRECNRTFSTYTGTWAFRIHKKNLLGEFFMLMRKGKSLEKSRKILEVNKKTVFDWRHKFTISLKSSDNDKFEGITESDETFFLYSKTGSACEDRKAHKRGKAVSKRGISKEHVSVIVTADRSQGLSLATGGRGRLTKLQLTKAIGEKVSSNTILCTDSHVSYKGFALDNKLEIHMVKASTKEFVKKKIFHIQHVNSLHSRLKKWINNELHGVATKYLQNYLNWFRFKEKFKNIDYMQETVSQSLHNNKARLEYLYAIENLYSQKSTLF